MVKLDCFDKRVITKNGMVNNIYVLISSYGMYGKRVANLSTFYGYILKYLRLFYSPWTGQ